MIAYLRDHIDAVLSLFAQHVQLAGSALGIAILIAFPLGLLVARYTRLYTPVMGVLGAAYTIPSLALFAILVPIVGIGFRNALIALVIYAQFILVRNVAVGLRGVDPAVLEAARGMGMNAAQILWCIELPLALPVIVAGVRIATVTVIGVTAIATYIAAGGLGNLLSEGVSNSYNEEIEAGVLAIVVLALLADLLLRAIEYLAIRASGRAPAPRAAQR